ncbi:MAG: chromate efflux transporter [Gemmatimonadetes bacterium]|nr:chromate efflux transporter [Gemmatimonadota bacterium]
MAWGGPVAQIAMIREELVQRERWIPPERFNRVLAVYQALPGPEAHELCVYFGTIARGRRGGLLAGLAFMLPGFCLMMGLSWAYVRWGIASPAYAAIFLGCQPAVVALIVRAVVRIGEHALTRPHFWIIAAGAAAATAGGANFLLTLLVAGAAATAIARTRAGTGAHAHGLVPLALLAQPAAALAAPGVLGMLGYGFRTGLLTFGGAYTAIPFLQHDAVVRGAWMTQAQFLDGIALSGLLPAPLIIFSTFVGYLGGGALGAIAMTVGVFAPAFAFTLIGHRHVERLVENTSAHAFLDGVTAGVVGLIAVTALQLFRSTVTTPLAVAIFLVALLLAFRWKARLAVVGIMVMAGLAGAVAILVQRLS